MTGLHLEHKQQKYFWVLGIPLIVAVLYGASIGSPFVYDDRIHIFENTDVTGFQGLMDFASVIRIFQSKFGLLGRPVLIVTYGLNYLYSGSDPAGFRLTNLFIHTANCLLVFVLILLLSRTFGGKNNRSFMTALLGAALFAAHPLLTESVTYIAGRSSSLCAFFYFAALVFVVQSGGRNGPSHAVVLLLAIACGVLAWLVKQDAVTLPLAAIGLVWLSWPRNTVRRQAIGTFVWVAILLAALLFQRGHIAAVEQLTRENSSLVAAGFEETIPLTPYLLTSIKELTTYYLWRMFVPVHLSVDPDPTIIHNLASPGLWISLVVLLSLCTAIWMLRKSRPVLAVGIMLIVISPLSAYAAFPLADVVAEHRAYISTLGAVIIMAAVLVQTRYPVVLSAVALVSYFWLTVDRNLVWRDEATLWRDAAQKAPEKLRPHLNLGALYQVRGDNQQAIKEYEFVLKRVPKHDAALANLGSVYLALNQVDQAETMLNRAITAQTHFPNTYINLAVVRLRQGRFEDARRLLKEAEALNPRQPMVHHNLGDIFFNEHHTSQAIVEYLAELQINPGSPITHLHLAMAYEASGSPADSLKHYLILQRLQPANTEVQAAIRHLQQ
ncbi:MAG: hypothetical protein DMG16_27185 [Acidobacteria bacterium]|nr:MAG: hypothetical protein DMG16_27185 [Acidobacteriota bacterium]